MISKLSHIYIVVTDILLHKPAETKLCNALGVIVSIQCEDKLNIINQKVNYFMNWIKISKQLVNIFSKSEFRIELSK